MSGWGGQYAAIRVQPQGVDSGVDFSPPAASISVSGVRQTRLAGIDSAAVPVDGLEGLEEPQQ